jgi:hypothetical protein
VRNRRAIRPPDLTSLFDVLFLFVFVSLVNAGMSRREADAVAHPAVKAPAAPVVKPPPPDLKGLRDQALAHLGDRIEVVARVSRAGALTELQLVDRTIASGVPLVERVADPDVGVRYLGEANPDLRVCRVIARALGATDLRGYLIVISPEAPLGALAHALVDGLRADEDRCLTEDRGVAVIVEPTP